MNLYIEKIGKIKKADIKINGLTLLVGKNDTGKSTFNKLIFSIIESINNYKIFFSILTKIRIENESFVPLLREYISKATPDDFLNKCMEIQEDLRLNKKFLSLDKIIETVNEIENKSKDIKDNKDILAYVSKIKQYKSSRDDCSDKEQFKEIGTMEIRSVFEHSIINSKHIDDIGKFMIYDNNNINEILMSAKVKNDFLEEDIILSEKVKAIIFRNVKYIETPFAIEKDVLIRRETMRDLQNSISQEIEHFNDDIALNKTELDYIQKYILKDAIFSYDKEKKGFIYKVDSSSKPLGMSNIASGVKSFALLFSLLKLNIFNKDTLLIIDEPENHLHPEWQIKYAELIAILVNDGFSILLSSHNPTFIQALNAYIQKYNIQNKSNFYLMEDIPSENYSIVSDVTNNMERIYANLVEPTDRLFAGL